MKAAVFYGTPRQGTTWRLTQEFLSGLGEVQLQEFYLPRDMGEVCTGCFSCMTGGGTGCPHAAAMAPLLEALDEADIVVCASPVYVMGMTAGLKAFFEHMACRWMVHRPEGGMFRKVGAAISTAAGPCTGGTLRAIRTQFRYLGIARTCRLGAAVGGGWDWIGEKKRRALSRKAVRLGRKAARRAGRVKPELVVRCLFRIMALVHRKPGWNPDEYEYWKARGWLDGKKPWTDTKTAS